MLIYNSAIQNTVQGNHFRTSKYSKHIVSHSTSWQKRCKNSLIMPIIEFKIVNKLKGWSTSKTMKITYKAQRTDKRQQLSWSTWVVLFWLCHWWGSKDIYHIYLYREKTQNQIGQVFILILNKGKVTDIYFSFMKRKKKFSHILNKYTNEATKLNWRLTCTFLLNPSYFFLYIHKCIHTEVVEVQFLFQNTVLKALHFLIWYQLWVLGSSSSLWLVE